MYTNQAVHGQYVHQPGCTRSVCTPTRLYTARMYTNQAVHSQNVHQSGCTWSVHTTSRLYTARMYMYKGSMYRVANKSMLMSWNVRHKGPTAFPTVLRATSAPITMPCQRYNNQNHQKADTLNVMLVTVAGYLILVQVKTSMNSSST